MTARAWELARQHSVSPVPPNPTALHNAVETVANGLRRIGVALADFHAAGLEIPGHAELDDLLAEVHATANRIAARRPAASWDSAAT